jgi:hypothetical protein
MQGVRKGVQLHNRNQTKQKKLQLTSPKKKKTKNNIFFKFKGSQSSNAQTKNTMQI